VLKKTDLKNKFGKTLWFKEGIVLMLAIIVLFGAANVLPVLGYSADNQTENTIIDSSQKTNHQFIENIKINGKKFLLKMNEANEFLFGKSEKVAIDLGDSIRHRNKIIVKRLDFVFNFFDKGIIGSGKKVKSVLKDVVGDKYSRVVVDLENKIKHRNNIIAQRFNTVGDQAIFISRFWQGEYNQKLEPITNKGIEFTKIAINEAGKILNNKFVQTNLAFGILPDKIKQIGQNSATLLIGFVDHTGRTGQRLVEVMSSELDLLMDSDKNNEDKKGRVAGISEEKQNQFTSRLLAMANVTANRGKQVVDSARNNTGEFLNQSADNQRELSYTLGKKLAKITLASAKKIEGYSESTSQKLVQGANKVQETNKAVEEYNESGKSYLAKETTRSLYSLADMYVRAVDFIIPDSLKSRYAQMYEAPQTIVTGIATNQPTVQQTVQQTIQQTIQQTVVNQPAAANYRPNKVNGNLDITGNVYISKELNVAGLARFDDQLTVLGGVDILNGLYNSQGILKVDDDMQVTHSLTTASLKVEGKSEFMGSINAVDIWANNLLARQNLKVVGDATIQGNESISGNLNVSGTFTAGQAIFANLGVSGLLSGRGVSAGEYGLFSSGPTNLNGEVNIAGRIDANNILDIDKASSVALTVGDGTTDTFIVDTSSDIVTIAGTTHFNGRTVFNGDMDLNGALDLDTASTSALAIGDGTDDNLNIDTINDQITIGNSSTTDTIIANAKQFTINSASTTPGILVNYDGTGNMIQFVDNAIDRFVIADYGAISQTASTTGYAYTINQTGTAGSLLDIQDEGFSRFTIADYGVANLIASSTSTALTVKQTDTGNILDLYDDTNLAFTILDGGNVGIATTSPFAKLSVVGDTYLGGDLTATGTTRLLADNYLGNATTTDITYFNSRIGTSLVPTIDNVLDIGDEANWLRWRTGLFGTSIGVAGTATTTGNSLTFTGVGDITMGDGSIIQTTSGALTITSAEGATWSTASGLLTLSGQAGITSNSNTGTYTVNATGQTINLDSAIFTLDTTSHATSTIGGNYTINTTGQTLIDTTGATTFNTGGTYTLDATGQIINITGGSTTFTTGPTTFNTSTYDLNNTGAITIGVDGSEQHISFETNNFDINSIGNVTIDGLVISLSGNTITTGTMTSNITDNTANSYLVREGANNYIDINTTNGAEAISFGNATTNPDFSFLGTGDTNFGGTLTATGVISTPYFTATSVTATSTFAGGLTVDTNKFVVDPDSGRVGIGTSSPSHELSVSGSAYITDNLIVGGDATIIGDTFSDTLIINSSINSDLIPDQNAVRDLGSGAYYWDNLYVDSINANNISSASTSISGTQSADFTLNSDNVTVDTEDAQFIFFRGTVVPNAIVAWDSTNDRFDINQPLFIQNDSDSDIVTLDIKGTAGQTADLFRVTSSSGSSLLVLDTSGNVGIGTSTPATKLQSLSTETQLRLGYDETNYIDFDVASDGDLSVSRNGAVAMLALTDVGVGIATTSPFAKLSVAGDTYLGGNLTATGTVTMTGLSAGEDNTILILNSSNQIITDEIDSRVWGTSLVDGSGIIGYPTYWSDENTLTAEQYLSVARGGTGIGSVTDGYFLIGNSGSALEATSSIFMDPLGNIGIGTTTSAAKLSIQSTGTQLMLAYDGDSYVTLSANSDGMLEISGVGGDVYIGDVGSASNLVFEEDSAILGQGTNTITLGESGDTFNLNTFGTTYNIQLWDDTPMKFGNSDDASIEWDTAPTTDALTFTGFTRFATTTNSVINPTRIGSPSSGDVFVQDDLEVGGTLYSSGNVGIGMTSPEDLLSIIGGEVNIGYIGNSVNTLLVTDSSIWSGVAGYTAAFNANGIYVAGESAFMNGSVGIGTTEPSNILQVSTADENVGRFTSTDPTAYIQINDNTDSFYLGTGSQMGSIGGNVGVTSGNLNIDLTNGNVGIGTTNPDYVLDVQHASSKINSKNGYLTDGADYAEYYFTTDADLAPGEAVCVDTTSNNAVKRCVNERDSNIMGIISTNPAFLGNNKEGYASDEYYKAVAMLGQIPAKVSTENGEIRPGDSLTAASMSGYIMRADAGDATVGVALEGLVEGTGSINVLISRRNKSLTVETIEEEITDRIANMEIEDEVNILIANAINLLDLNDEIDEVIDPKLLLLTTQLVTQTDDLDKRILNNEDDIADIAKILSYAQEDIIGIKNDLAGIQDDIYELYNSQDISSFQTIVDSKFTINNNGNLVIGAIPLANATSTPEVQIIEPMRIIASATQAVFVVDQTGQGDVADFQYNQVSIMNINNQGKVSVIGELLIDGRMMACAGGSCGTILENAVDETMGDIGVEGKVVAGAFEGYCDDGYIWVPGSAKYGTMPGFCVMAYKAGKNIENTIIIRQTLNDNEVWTDVSQGEAQLVCQNLGNGYHLISENEWLTITENIIRVVKNDVNVDIDGMQLATTSQEFVLTNDNIVYEFTGVLAEWTDRIISSSALPEPVLDEWQEYYAIDMGDFNFAPPYYYNSSNGIGMIKVGDNDNNLRGFVRGYEGIYSLDLSNSPIIATPTIGFRCAK